MRGNVLETKSVMLQFAEVKPEYLFVQIPEQVEWFDAHVSAFQSALEQTPKVLQSVCVNLTVNVTFGIMQ